MKCLFWNSVCGGYKSSHMLMWVMLLIFSSLKQERFHKKIRCKANMYGGTQKSGHPAIHLEDDFWDDIHSKKPPSSQVPADSFTNGVFFQYLLEFY